MQEFLQEWAALSFVSMSGLPVRKYEGHFLDDMIGTVERVESLPSANDLDAISAEQDAREATNG